MRLMDERHQAPIHPRRKLMIGRKTVIGLALVCSLVLTAFGAQAASAATNGQTIFECSKSASTKTFVDAHCDKTEGTKEYGHVLFPSTATAITLTNGATAEETKASTPLMMEVKELKGFKNVTITCHRVAGTGTAQNSLSGEEHKGIGGGTFEFTECTTNQAGCPSATVNQIVASFRAVTPSASEMGLEFFATTGGVLTKVKFNGTCGVAALGEMPIEGSLIGTAGGAPNGRGATDVFLPEASMSKLTLLKAAMTVEGTVTLKRTSTGNALVLTTSPFLNDE
jgi:hypothetical protein